MGFSPKEVSKFFDWKLETNNLLFLLKLYCMKGSTFWLKTLCEENSLFDASLLIESYLLT